ncbi:MAG: N-acetyl sugar amidotransferase [Candidatus Curtissbacteria bacterium]|nr:N-acetyl sugar amidotransferase [Candidatus Curtissbacteria bacterium]
MQYCTKCVYPISSAVKLTFDNDGVCSGCRVSEARKKINWRKRAKLLESLAEDSRVSNGSNYDCIIPVSGGKDSYFQTHYVTKVLKLKPLLVTYHGNNYLPEGEYNLNRMHHVFNVDHIIFKPNVDVLVKLNRICFKKMGDMNWHAHCGIFTYPVQIAVKFKIKLIVWGEHGYTDLGGMYRADEFPEMTAKYRFEHALRGFDWYDMVGEEGLKEQDLLWAKYPTEEELEESEVRGIYLGNYVDWDANKQYKLMQRLYNWQQSKKPFDRTYRRFSNLDDMHENGVHDYLKFVKFGYGRATDHACKDIRSGYITRKKAIDLVRKYDHVKPRDLKRWLQYVGMKEKEFDKTADQFRDARVWRKNKGKWEKDNIWDEEKN